MRLDPTTRHIPPVRGLMRLLRVLAQPHEPSASDVSSPSRGGRGLLEGRWLGHAAHPMLTDFTTGPWMAATFLDVFGPPGSRRAARRLVGLGLAAAVPTLATGVAEWRRTAGPTRRLGVVHGLGSTVATVLYTASYLARRRGHHPHGVVYGLLGGVVEMADGWIGGDLTLTAGAGHGRR